MADRIKHRGRKLAVQLAGGENYFYLSPLTLILWRKFRKILAEANFPSVGKVLDAGAGHQVYRPYLETAGLEYVAIDFKSDRVAPDCLANLEQLPFGSDSFKVVFCTQVLEHVPHPQAGLVEINRVLEPGGVLILSVPHLAYLHNEPYDFFRYTPHGLKILLEESGFEVEEITAAGGLIAFLAQLSSTIMTGLTPKLPVIEPLALLLNRWMNCLLVWLDEKVGCPKLFAANYVVVARKTVVRIQ